MTKNNYHIILADDDEDDRIFFKEALSETVSSATINTANDGLELMNMLSDKLPDAIFLDLNMPFKNGQECLYEIKTNRRYKNIPVVIYSTSSNVDQINSTFKAGANLYISKPDSYIELKIILKKVFTLKCEEYKPQPDKEKFVLKY
ncbi:response regulator [Emticicia sp. BO119]|uniref:response regulator n=1 Tax=Emticicia sp. BO119 TaxID=2757768 RepID=UPI0015F0946F|nr:response regulator [Emticicia sp. BO119]MBA4849225.1 response regulator [Emticicia sp. BO119]